MKAVLRSMYVLAVLAMFVGCSNGNGGTGGGTGGTGGGTAGGTGGGTAGGTGGGTAGGMGGMGGGGDAGGAGGGGVAPGVPMGVVTTPGNGAVNVAWGAVSGALNYNVYYGTAAGVTTASTTKSTAIAALSTQVTGLVNGTTYHFIVTAVGAAGEGVASGEVTATPVAGGTSTPNDPLFATQWHLKNTGQLGQDGVAALVGEDLNATPVWPSYIGSGVRIAVVDDGLDILHEDLAPNVVPNKSWDYTQAGGGAYGNPSGSTGSHGTSCGGLAAAKGDNGLGVTGVAYGASLVGYNLLAPGNTNSAADAHAITLDLATNDVYSNSYGATDSTGMYFESDAAWRAAIDTGTATGRAGRGAVYTWAAGNGSDADRSDYDGQANYNRVLAIGALNNQGKKSSYSEEGANVLVMAYGGEFCDTQQVTTTDITAAPGYNNGASANDLNGQPNYTRCFNGTSAATPQATGSVALLLNANPNLTWRDVRYILATSARRNDPADADWVQNKGGTGIFVNHKYGYGAINVAAAVTKATGGYVNLPAMVSPSPTANATVAAIPDNTGASLTQTISVSGSGITKLEFVELTVASDHTDVGDLAIALTTPSGTVRTLAVTHACQSSSGTAVACGAWASGSWRFGIAQLIDEPANGTWTLTVKDSGAAGSGSLNSWSLQVYGH